MLMMRPYRCLSVHLLSLFILSLPKTTVSGQEVQFRLEALDEQLSQPLTEVGLGDTFLLRGITEHLQPEGRGVFAAYLDVAFDDQLVELAGPVAFSDWFPNGHLEMSLEPGLINDVGGFGPIEMQPELQRELFEVPIRAIGMGEITFDAQAPGRPPFTDTLVYFNDDPIPESEIEFVGTSIRIVPEPSAGWLAVVAVVCLGNRYRRA